MRGVRGALAAHLPSPYLTRPAYSLEPGRRLLWVELVMVRLAHGVLREVPGEGVPPPCEVCSQGGDGAQGWCSGSGFSRVLGS